MSKTDTMAKPLGVFRRKAGGIFQLRVMVPLELRPQYGGKTKIIESLGTADPKAADDFRCASSGRQNAVRAIG